MLEQPEDPRAQDDIPDVLEEEGKTTVSDTAPDTMSSTSTKNTPDNAPGTLPSMGGDEELVVCKNNNRGHCILHGIKMTKLDISKKIWADKGVKGFGWKTIKNSKIYLLSTRTVQL